MLARMSRTILFSKASLKAYYTYIYVYFSMFMYLNMLFSFFNFFIFDLLIFLCCYYSKFALQPATRGKEVDDLIQDPTFREIFWEEHQQLFPGAAASAASGTLILIYSYTLLLCLYS